MIEDDFPLLPGALPFLGGVEAWRVHIAAWERWMKARPDLLPQVRMAAANQVPNGGDKPVFFSIGKASVSAKFNKYDLELIESIFTSRSLLKKSARERMSQGEVELCVRDALSISSQWEPLGPDRLRYVGFLASRYATFRGAGRYDFRMRETRGSPATMSLLLYANKYDAEKLLRLTVLRLGSAREIHSRCRPDHSASGEAGRRRFGSVKEFDDLWDDCFRRQFGCGEQSGKFYDELAENLRRGEEIAASGFGVFPPCAWAGIKGEDLRDRYQALRQLGGGMRFDSIEDFYELVVESEQIEAEFSRVSRKMCDEAVARLRRGDLIAARLSGAVSPGDWIEVDGDSFLSRCAADVMIRSATAGDNASSIEKEPKCGRPKIDQNAAVFRKAYELELAGMKAVEAQNAVVGELRGLKGTIASRCKAIERGVVKLKRADERK